MKKVFAGLFGLILLVVGIVVVRTLQNAPKAQSAAQLTLIDVDSSVAARHLAEAVRFRTVTMQERSKTDWAVFGQFQNWMAQTYPHFYQTVTSEQVDTYSQLNIWQGSDGALDPVVFMAHQDVVPAHLEDGGWDYPPFDGVIADGFVYGRGSIDDKSALIGLLEAADRLAANGYKPRRTLIFAFGHDEEVAGTGAKAIVDVLKSRGVHPWAVIDEGGAILSGMPGLPDQTAMIGVAEKGYVTLKLVARGRGGHSSTPPKDTAIGRLSRAIKNVEAHPFVMKRDKVMNAMLSRAGQRSGFGMRMITSNLWLFGPLVDAKLKKSDFSRAMMGTTIAPTIIKGGFKENVLPREATAFINFRIHQRDSIESVLAHVKNAVADPEVEISVSEGVGAEPSPVSQIGTGPWLWLTKVIGETFPKAMAVPYTVPGGTDSRHYAAITKDTYRFVPYELDTEDMERIHGRNERLSISAFAKAVQVYAELMREAGQ